MIPLVSFDLETFRLGPGAVAPKPVCGTESVRLPSGEVRTRLISNGDADWLPWVEDMVTGAAEGRHRLVGANVTGFDFPVLHVWFPHLRPALWKALMREAVHDVQVREKLLNLALVGQIDHWYTPDGKQRDFAYNLAALCAKYLGKDRKREKGMDSDELEDLGLTEEQQDIWRMHFDQLDGVPSSDYPPEAADYAKHDTADTLLVYEAQEARAEELRQRGARFPDGTPFDPFRTEPLHVAAKMSLQLMTIRGLLVDPEEVKRLRAVVERELVPARLAKLVLSKILTLPEPVRPYAKGQKHGAYRKKPCTCAAPSHEPGAPMFLHAEPHHVSKTLLGLRVLETVARVNAEAGDDRVRLKFTEPSDTFPSDLQFQAWEEEAARGSEEAGRKVKRARKNMTSPLRAPVVGGQVSTDAEVIADLAAFDPVLAEYDHWSSLQKMMTNELPRLDEAVAHGGTMHPGFEELKKTSRTSSRRSKFYPSTNIQQIARMFEVEHPCEGCVGKECPRCKGEGKWKVKIEPRNAYIARPGWLLASVDYSTLELVTAAQQVYKTVGYSVMRDKLVKGFDLHGWFAGVLCRSTDHDFSALCHAALGEQAVDPDAVSRLFDQLKRGSKPEKEYHKAKRQFAKSPNLALPGGMGARTLVSYAKKTYGVLFDSLEQAKTVKDLWLSTFPEFNDYFSWVKRDCRDREHSEPGEQRYAYWSPLGTYRANCYFTECANGYALQTPSAEGAKLAMVDVARACFDPTLGSCLYGCFPLAFIHDEMIVEVPDDRWAPERTAEIERLMVKAMERICPDVPVKAEPTLMRKWSKGASYVKWDDGRLAVWEDWLAAEAKKRAASERALVTA